MYSYEIKSLLYNPVSIDTVKIHQVLCTAQQPMKRFVLHLYLLKYHHLNEYLLNIMIQIMPTKILKRTQWKISLSEGCY